MIINTTYDVFCSPYFPIENTVVVNNITARARTNVWMASRCLQGLQLITDGFQYTPLKVLSFRQNKMKKKPGFETLSNLALLKKHKSIQEISLSNINWEDIFNYNQICEKDLVFYIKKAHYGLCRLPLIKLFDDGLLVNSEIRYYKIRGVSF